MANTASGARSEQTEVTLRSKAMYLDFEGECELERDGNAVRPTGLRLVAELPDAGGPEDGGTVVLELVGESLAAAVEQPGGRVQLTTLDDVRWIQGRNGDLALAADEIGFVLPESPESTVLSVRGLTVRTKPS